ncbi:hypothetical protein [Streptomyces sp. CBMA29]|uniref:hypothetical protein n=1 Tax=Streptomyces sp. CBMA29 TaxID=1896314 RepID=UPI001661A966|nr:hypothetical protein [Streptomyces sp. CBMA29]MBD0735774.1 hypothetical protein [Streptomyces sp. CBMA29]
MDSRHQSVRDYITAKQAGDTAATDRIVWEVSERFATRTTDGSEAADLLLATMTTRPGTPELAPVGPDFEDVSLGDTVTADRPPRCHGEVMRDLSKDADQGTRADMDAGQIGRWQCWVCDCELYTDANGVVCDFPDPACGDHCTC